MSKLYALKGKIQNYAWGGANYIPDLLGFKSEEKKYAEYWLGAHVNASSVLTTPNGDERLDDYLNSDLNKKLGTRIAEKFGRLPLLFKVLDVNDVLSIQVHPTKTEAEKGFAPEEGFTANKHGSNG